MAAFVNGGARRLAISTPSGSRTAGRWVAVEEATFVHSEDIRSPMGGGYTAHADSDAARQLQAEVGGSC
jgi:hypothetical protein